MPAGSRERPAKLYLAGALFSLEERRWNEALGREIERCVPDVTVLLPQSFEHKRGATPAEIFRTCIDEIEEADALLALLDGQEADSGTCFEVGYARARGKPVLGVRTDYRRDQDRGLNLMLRHACDELVTRYSFEEGTPALARAIARKLQGLLADRPPREPPRAGGV
jgi:nucleoside 2-deoxyribosyltransferase